MSRTRKALIFVFSALMIVCLSLFTVSACKSKKALKSIKITTPPEKVVYIDGETFNATGMVVTAYYDDESEVALESTAWDYDFKEALTVSGTSFEGSKTIKVSYTEGETTVTANQTVKITNHITGATIKTNPKQDYYLGQSFNIEGMVITATLQNNQNRDIEVTASNSTVKPEGPLSKEDKEVTVTVGGYDVKVPVTVLNALYVEAETGYRDGALIDQSTGDSGNLRTDATTEDAQKNAKDLYGAHLKAVFALSKLSEDDAFDAAALDTQVASPDELAEVFGGNKNVYKPEVTVGGKTISKLYIETVKWLKADANKAAIEAYVESDEYKAAIEAYVAGTNEDIAEWNYTTDVERYTAHAGSDGNEYYLGQNNQGHIISFVFDSSAAATGSVAFRLSSAYLYADSGWSPIMMGDVQFNKLAEIYVNGVKMNIGDDKILLGGRTEDGSTNGSLWVNWDTVKFDDVAFVEGRNVVELRILRHGITAQEGYNFAANVDTLLVAPAKVGTADACELDTYDNSNVSLTATVSSVAIDGNNLKLQGTIAGATGYVGDLLGIKLGDTAANVVLNGSNFTATVDVSEIELGDYKITVNGTQLKNEGITLDTATKEVGTLKLTFSADDQGVINLNVDSDVKFELKDATLGTDIRLEKTEDKVYIVLGGTYDYEAAGKTDDEIKVDAAAEIKKAIYTDLQANPNEGDADNGWGTPLKNTHEIVIKEGKTFEVRIDLTSLEIGRALTFHIDSTFHPVNSHDYKPEIDAFAENKVEELNGIKYEMIYNKSSFFSCVGIRVSDAAAAVAQLDTNMTLVEKEGKVYVEVKGTYSKMTPDEVKATYAFDASGAQSAPKTEFKEDAGNITWTFDEEKGTFTVTLDVTNLQVENGYWMHYANGDGKDLTCKANAESAITVGNKTYVFKNVVFSWGNRDLLCVENATTDAPAA